jgi:hypothetical protein
MSELRFTHPLHRRPRRATIALALLIAVGSLSGVGVAAAQALPSAASEAAAASPQLVGSPALMKASPKLFNQSGAVIASSGDGAEANSPAGSPGGFVQKVREARGAGGS